MMMWADISGRRRHTSDIFGSLKENTQENCDAVLEPNIREGKSFLNFEDDRKKHQNYPSATFFVEPLGINIFRRFWTHHTSVLYKSVEISHKSWESFILTSSNTIFKDRLFIGHVTGGFADIIDGPWAQWSRRRGNICTLLFLKF